MKKFLLFSVAILAITGIVYAEKYNTEQKGAELSMSDIEVLTVSEKGCVNKPDKNNGNCTTDGTYYFCEDGVWYKSDNCVKNLYY